MEEDVSVKYWFWSFALLLPENTPKWGYLEMGPGLMPTTAIWNTPMPLLHTQAVSVP